MARATPEEDAATVAALDTAYQAAVERNDVAGMDCILADDFTLVVGSGKAFTKAELLDSARGRDFVWQIQAEEAGTQQVRVHGDTAVVTALLRLKGTHRGQPIDKRLWFSDTYVRTPSGWRYFFGQASLALPAETKPQP
ncbi:MAG TPA: nuclear transport factor 2 family protein [Acidobacteriota bacterium]|nr:nuclear transport factor 2 family protein [Acidobacteriota bacterium]